MKVGVFPLGPTPAAQRARHQADERLIRVIGRLLEARQRLIISTCPSDLAPFLAVLGEPGECLICGARYPVEKPPMDLDYWFCPHHCPICNGLEVITEAS
jgi:hypothetical protein